MSSMKKNGYLSPPILDTEKGVCFNCGKKGDTAVHEIYFGRGNRKVSKQQGFYVHLCPTCHRIVHEKPDDGELDGALKRSCYRVYCYSHDKEVFKELIGRYYE